MFKTAKRELFSKVGVFISILFISLKFVIGQNVYNPNLNTGGGSKIADHSIVKELWQGKIPESAIVAAKKNLKIGYGHTSHGNQLVLGMAALVEFANRGTLGSAGYSQNLFAVSQNGGTDTLHLFNGSDYNDNEGDWLSGDAGWAGAHFAEETREFLNNPAHSNFNVIIWSWCGQLSIMGEYDVLNDYLTPMSKLEEDFPNVTFIYMTGHLDQGKWNDYVANINARNEQIRQYCKTNNKWLYDFADIESYDPDGNYYLNKLATDACNYDKNGDGVISQDSSDPPIANGGDGNWALEWQNAHTKNVDWFHCGADVVHTQQINGNMKAYAAWWLWARLGGWVGNVTSAPNGLNKDKINIYPGLTKGPLSISMKNSSIDTYKYEIYNSMGKMIMSKENNSGNEISEIDLSIYPSGIYIIVIKLNSETYKYRVVKISE